MKTMKSIRKVTAGSTFLVILLGLASFPVAFADSISDATEISLPSLTEVNNVPDLGENSAVSPQSSISYTPDIDQAVMMAVQWHPSISQAVGKLFQKAAEVDVAKAKYYPQVNAGMNNGYSNSYVNSGYSPSLVLSVSQMLYDFGKVSSSVRSANAGVAQQQANVMLSISQVTHTTASDVVQVQTYQKLVAIAEQQLQALEHIGQLIQQRNTAGASSLSDVVQTNARIEGARATLMQYQASLHRWQGTLGTDMGTGPVNTVSDQFPARLVSGCMISHIDNGMIPGVLAAYAQRTQAQADLDNANASMKPTLSLEPQVTHYLNNNYSDSRELSKTQYSAWIKLEVPLYQGGGLTASRNAAVYNLETARAAIQLAELQTRQKLTESQDQAKDLYLSLAVQNRQQALAEKTRDLYQAQYLQLGSRPLLDLLNVEQEIYQAKFSQEQTLSQLHLLQLNCLESTGQIINAFSINNLKIQGVTIHQ